MYNCRYFHDNVYLGLKLKQEFIIGIIMIESLNSKHHALLDKAGGFEVLMIESHCRCLRPVLAATRPPELIASTEPMPVIPLDAPQRISETSQKRFFALHHLYLAPRLFLMESSSCCIELMKRAGSQTEEWYNPISF